MSAGPLSVICNSVCHSVAVPYRFPNFNSTIQINRKGLGYLHFFPNCKIFTEKLLGALW